MPVYCHSGHVCFLPTMDLEKPIKEGYLLFPPQGVLGQLKKSWHKKYCQLFKSSKRGIERLEVFDSEDDAFKTSSIRIITLENCIKITQDAQKHQNYVFAIVTKTSVYHFASLTDKEMFEWLSAFQSVAFKDDCSKKTIEEDNDLYCSSGEGVFIVKLVPTEASERCGLEPGIYTLVVASAAIQLWRSCDHHLLFTWPYRYIRRYGYREGKFIFEAGRKCDTGEGTFTLEHSNQQEIFRCLSSKMKSMRKLLTGEAPLTPAIVCGDNQFQAALSMEARSRSPLPPSPTSATPIAELDFNSSSKLHLSFVDNKSFTNNNMSSIPKPKPKPIKPPRKHIFSQEKKHNEVEDAASEFSVQGYFKKLSSNDLSTGIMPPLSAPPLSSAKDAFNYDKVEIRKEAWRTLGLDDVKHTENHNSYIEEDPLHTKVFIMPQTIEDKTSQRPQLSKILLSQVSTRSESLDSYDKLQHLGLSSKSLNCANSHGYTHIPVSSTVSCNHIHAIVNSDDQQVATSEYDAIENMQACRLADDSHYGYGMIRKKSVPSESLEHGPDHKVYNELEYAIVQKPKRV